MVSIDNNNGHISISRDVFSNLAGDAATNCFGVKGMAGKNKEGIFQLLKRQNEPVGIFCYHDLLAVQLYTICDLIGKRIPEDVGIVGFDDLSIATSLTPALTTIQYRIASMADMTVNLLMTSIRSANAPYDNYYVEPNLIIRGSSTLSDKFR